MKTRSRPKSNRPQRRNSRKTMMWGAAGVAAAAAGAAVYASSRSRSERLPVSEDARRPSWRKFLAEFPAAGRLLAAQFMPVPISRKELGRGRPVLVIPGFLANDIPTTLLRRTLATCGFRPFGWDNGTNLGMRDDLFERLEERLDTILAEAEGPVALVGWSLGGLYARELAKRQPGRVAMVVTLGTPFSVDLRDNNAWKLYETINDHPVDNPPVDVRVDEKPPVPTIAIWSPRDGIVAPASASGKPWESDEQIRVTTKHNELVSDPEALRQVVEILARPWPSEAAAAGKVPARASSKKAAKPALSEDRSLASADA
jgi:pimeloyl-ACP methyl ester carboxylesterase